MGFMAFHCLWVLLKSYFVGLPEIAFYVISKRRITFGPNYHPISHGTRKSVLRLLNVTIGEDEMSPRLTKRLCSIIKMFITSDILIALLQKIFLTKLSEIWTEIYSKIYLSKYYF